MSLGTIGYITIALNKIRGLKWSSALGVIAFLGHYIAEIEPQHSRLWKLGLQEISSCMSWRMRMRHKELRFKSDFGENCPVTCRDRSGSTNLPHVAGIDTRLLAKGVLE